MFNSVVLAKFIMKRERIQIPLWLLGIIGFTLIIPPAYAEVFPTEIERLGMAETMSNPAMIAMVGPIFDSGNYTIGAMFSQAMLLFIGIIVALMNIFFVVRHTRADEENGRSELIRSLPTGRLSGLISTLMVSTGVNLILGLFLGLGLYFLKIEGMDLNGSLLFGAVLSATGIMFASFTALFAQLSKNTRTVLSYSFSFLGLAYLMRAVGDVGQNFLTWISPLGLVLQAQVYVNNYWWPVGLVIIMAIIVAGIALYLNKLRDLGDGFINERPGREKASIILQSYGGLTFKLVKTTICSWVIAMFLIGVSYGAIFGDLESFFAGNEMLQQILAESGQEFSMAEQFLPILMVISAIVATIPTLTLVLRVIGEEKKNRIEQVLSRNVSRTTILGSYVFSGFVTSIIAVLAAVLGLYLASSAVMENPMSKAVLLKAGLVYLPAIWMMLGIAVVLVGFFQKYVNWIWLYLGYAFIATYLGGILDLPEWMLRISPFGGIPQIPIEEMSWRPLVFLSGIAVVLTIIGFVGFKKRDIEG